MEIIILILLLIILFFIIFNYKSSETLNNNKNKTDSNKEYEYIMTMDNQNSFFNNKLNDNILLVGTDKNNNSVFKYNDMYYKMDNNQTLVTVDSIDNDNFKYYEYPKKIPFNSTNMKLKVNLTYKDHTYVGVLSNKYYNQQYILYEKPYDNYSELQQPLYHYILVKILNGEYTIMYQLPPRYKINAPDEYIWASDGAFQFGPLVFN